MDNPLRDEIPQIRVINKNDERTAATSTFYADNMVSAGNPAPGPSGPAGWALTKSLHCRRTVASPATKPVFRITAPLI